MIGICEVDVEGVSTFIIT